MEILLVDDRAENLLALEAVLFSKEYRLVKCASGDEALRYLLDHSPALILMDVQMPELDGFETAALIKKNPRTREIPIIFITAINKETRFVHKGYSYGAIDYIYKPYDAHVLRAKVAVLFELRRQHERMARLVAVQRATTQALADAPNTQYLTPSVLRAIAVSLGADMALFWRFDRDSGTYCGSAEWHEPALVKSSLVTHIFRERLSLTHGLPKERREGGQVAWIHDLEQGSLPLRYREAANANFASALYVPIEFQGELLGILELFSQRSQCEDHDLLRILGAIGSQIAQFLKRAEATQVALASEARKTAVIESSLDGVFTMDGRGRLLEFSPAAEAIFGLSRKRAIGAPFAAALIAESAAASFEFGGDSGEPSQNGIPLVGQRIQVPGRHADGHTFPLELTLTQVGHSSPALYTGFARDITERKRWEARLSLLADASAQLSSSLNYEETLASVAMLASHALGDWCAVDIVREGERPRRVAVAHKVPAKDAFIKDMLARFPRSLEDDSGPGCVFRTGQSILSSEAGEETLRKAAACPEHFEMLKSLGIRSVMMVPLKARSRVLGVLTFMITETDTRYTAEDLAVAEELANRAGTAIDNSTLYRESLDAVRSRDEFFSIASHELKTPITSLKLVLQMIQRGTKPREGIVPPIEKLSRALDLSTREVDRLAHLVDDLLDVTKIRAGKLAYSFEDFDLVGLVNEVVDQHGGALANAKCAVSVKTPEHLHGRWDPTRLSQVLVNLLTNALKYAGGSPVEIVLEELEGERVRLKVSDQGPGIAPDQQARIFERFERASPSKVTGLGLGLFIVKKIVEAHRGLIIVESAEGQGSTFSVDLPLRVEGEAVHRGESEASRLAAGATP